jgi:glycosyltransferase involved in cell wall biosynthesis
MSAELPSLSVVMPVKNGEQTLAEALTALADQHYAGWWELVVVSGGSTDRTVEIAESFTDQIPNLTILASDIPAIPAVAQNRGVQASTGKVIVFLDADDMVGTGYLESMGTALAVQPLVGATMDITRLNPPSDVKRRRPLQTDLIESFCNYRPAVIGSTMGVQRSAFDQVGGFDETLATQQDLDLSWRLYDAGYPPVPVPAAVLHYRYRSKLAEIFRQHYKYGWGEVQLYRKHRAGGMPGRTIRQVFGGYYRLLTALPGLASKAGRQRVATIAGMLSGRLSGSVKLRLLYP